jgi:hypothetical protein
MTLAELKSKATAAELALIEAVEKGVVEEARSAARKKFRDAVEAAGEPTRFGGVLDIRDWWERVMKKFDEMT